jgi:hypothetical protein
LDVMGPVPAIEVGLGVLRPRMARAAAASADLALTWMTPPAYLRRALVPQLTRPGTGRSRPPVRLASVVPFVVDRSGRK